MRHPKHLLAYHANHGQSPIPGWGFGKGGLFYKLPRMHGGMAQQDINTGKIIDELYDRYALDRTKDNIIIQDDEGDEIEIPMYKHFIDLLMNDDNLSDEQKRNILIKEALDNQILKEQAKNEEDNILETEARRNIKDILKPVLFNFINENIETKPELFNDEVLSEINKIWKIRTIKTKGGEEIERDEKPSTGEFKASEIQKNPFYDTVNRQSKDYFDRGNISEDLLEKNNALLASIDNDESVSHNTKDIDAFKPEFINKLSQLFTGQMGNYTKALKQDNPMAKKLLEDIKKNFLEFIPVDIVKGNTVWELKSFKDNIYDNDKNQEMKYTKLEGFKKNIQLPKDKYLNYEYKMDIRNGKLYNINFVIGYNNIGMTPGFTLKTLPEQPIGYNYYWGYNNKNSFGYINPLKRDNYNDIKKSKYTNNNDIDVFKVENSKIRKLPNTYTKLYNDKIRKNKSIDINQYKRDIFERYKY